MNKIDNKSITKAVKWSFLAELLIKLVGPITNMVLARLLLPSAFGLVATITIVTSFAEVLTDAGFQKYIVQHEFCSEKEFNKCVSVAFFSNFVLSLFVVGIIISFKNYISQLIGASELSRAIVVSSFSIVFNSYSSIQVSAYKRYFDFKTLFSFRIFMAVLPLITTVPLAFYFKSYWSLVIGGLICSFIQFVILSFKPKVKIELYYSINVFKEMFSFSFWTLLESLTIWLTSNIDIFIVSKVFDDYYVGLYKTSTSTVDSVLGIVSVSIIPVLFSTLSRYQNNETEFKNVFLKFQKISAVFLIPMGLGIFLFKDFVTFLLLGKNWSEAALFIGMYSIAVSFQIIVCYFASEVFRSKGQPRISMLYQWIYIIILVPTILYFSNKGYSVFCFIRSISGGVFVLIALVFLQVLYRISMKDIIKNIFPQIVSALIMFCFGYCLIPYFQGFFFQLLLIIICAFVYFVILLLLSKSIRTMVMGYVELNIHIIDRLRWFDRDN